MSHKNSDNDLELTKKKLSERVRLCEQRWLESVNKDKAHEQEYFEEYMAANDEWVEFFEQHLKHVD